MVRVQTNILCDEDLKEAAKKEGISLSAALEEALRLRLALPKEVDEISNKIKSLEEQLEYMRSSKFNEIQVQEQKKEAKIKEEKKKDIETLKTAFSRKLKGEIKDETYNKILKAYCLKYNCELVQAVTLSQTKF